MDDGASLDSGKLAGPLRVSRRQVFQATGLVGLLEFVSACSGPSSVAVKTTTSNAVGSRHVVLQ